MADLDLKISGPVSTVIDAVSRVAVAMLENDAERRKTMSQESRDMQDRIIAQIYWDWRSILQALKIVGDPGKAPAAGQPS